MFVAAKYQYIGRFGIICGHLKVYALNTFLFLSWYLFVIINLSNNNFTSAKFSASGIEPPRISQNFLPQPD